MADGQIVAFKKDACAGLSLSTYASRATVAWNGNHGRQHGHRVESRRRPDALLRLEILSPLLVREELESFLLLHSR